MNSQIRSAIATARILAMLVLDMHVMAKHVITAIVVTAIVGTAPAITAIPVFAQDDFNSLLQDVTKKSRQLERLIESSNERGIDTRRASVTVDVVNQFVTFATWDHANKKSLQAVIAQWEPVVDSAEEIADELAIRELRDCIAILDQSYQELVANQSNENDPNAGFEIDPNLIIANGANYFQGARPVFPHSILWAPENLSPRFGQFSLGYMHPDYLNEHGEPINSGQRDWFASQLDLVSANNRKAYLFLGHVAPTWATNAKNTTGATTYIDYNIDHPDVKIWWRSLLEGLGPSFYQHPAALKNTMMANEPHWFVTENLWGYVQIPELTQQLFRQWLLQRHKSLQIINTRWKSTYSDIDEIVITTPIAPEQIGSGMWYDWCQFNMHRSMAFFRMLDSEIRRVEPKSLNHVKLPSQLFIDTSHDHGINWVRIADEFNTLGIDCTVTSHSGISRFPLSDRQAMYSIDWAPSLVALDLLKSISPEKIVFDSEWHAASNIHWRDPDMTHRYLRSVLWMHHLSGVGINQAWYWGRGPDGAPLQQNQNEFYGSLTTQPKSLNAYLQTMIELNDHATEIVNIASADRPVGLLYCEDSAINDPSYLNQFSNAYQALRFTGLRVNIIPVELISRFNQVADSADSSVQVLIIPPTKYISNDNIQNLQQSISRFNTVFQIGTGNLLFNPYGEAHPGSARQILKRAGSIANGTPMQLHDSFCISLANLIQSNPAIVTRQGKPPWGLLQFHEPDGISVLTNVLNDPIDVTIGSEQTTIQPMDSIVVHD